MNNRTIGLYLLSITLECRQTKQTVAVTKPALSRGWRGWLGPCDRHWSGRSGTNRSPHRLPL